MKDDKGGVNMQLSLITTMLCDNKKEVAKKDIAFIKDSGIENEVINIYPEIKYQKFEGFGGALTDSAGYVYSKMNSKQKEHLLETYFGKGQMNYQFARIHLDSCDFSLEHYEAMSDEKDTEMKSFSLERSEKYIFPLLEDVQKVLGEPIEIMVSPWSPPAFMKSNRERNHGGKLLEEYKAFWAEYICKYILEFKKRGYKVNKMTLQNEPKAEQTWDSCVYTAEEEKAFLKDFMYPALLRHNLSEVEIFIWDHNKERVFERTAAIIDEETDKMVAGIAFHWYSGDHFEAVDLVRQKYPNKKLALSEACIEYCKYGADDYLANAQKYAHDIIGNLNSGMHLFYDWNILLDQNGGPNHVNNYCDAPFLYDIERQQLIERNTLHYLKHFSQYIQPGAVRIAFSRYTDLLEVTVFENADGSIAAVVLNRSKMSLKANIRLEGLYAPLVIKPQSLSTCIIKR